MDWKFKSAELPYNDIADFKTTDISVDIICRVWLSNAPSAKHEKMQESKMERIISQIVFTLSVLQVKTNQMGMF